jgi:hypothetical protein
MMPQRIDVFGSDDVVDIRVNVDLIAGIQGPRSHQINDVRCGRAILGHLAFDATRDGSNKAGNLILLNPGLIYATRGILG